MEPGSARWGGAVLLANDGERGRVVEPRSAQVDRARAGGELGMSAGHERCYFLVPNLDLRTSAPIRR